MKSCDILIIEDDPPIRSLIEQTLEPLGLKLSFETDGAMGEVRAREYLPSVILLDLGLPSMSGIEILKKLKPWFAGGVIVITAWGDEEKKIEAFDLGAIDYVPKPFSPRELLARVKVALKHSDQSKKPANMVSVGNLVVDYTEHRITVGGEVVPMTQNEFKFLARLTHEPGRLVSQHQFLTEIWGPNRIRDTHYLRILVSRLRKKLEQAGATASIVTEAGLGYRVEEG